MSSEGRATNTAGAADSLPQDHLAADQRREPPPPPPDGGYGWICVLAQFFINGFTWGVAASYSVYLAYYLTHDIFSEARPMDYAFIGGFNFAFALLVAPLATLLMRLYGVRTPMFFGVVLLPTGFVSASFATRVWHLYLTQGICVGTGIGLIYIPATTIIPQWFSEKRSLANGICAAGSGIGGLCVCFATQGMLEATGLAWALRITAVIVFMVNLVATLLIRSRNEEIKPDLSIFNFRLLSSYEVKLLLGWSIILMFGYITLMFSLSDYAIGIGRSRQDSATVAAVLNLGAAIGRPFIGYVSDRFGRVEVAGVATFSCGVLVSALWLPTTNYGVLITFALVSGAILGIFWAAIAPLAADVVGLKELPAFLSIVWLSVVLPSAFAEPIALQLRRQDFGEFITFGAVESTKENEKYGMTKMPSSNSRALSQD
ncbi:MFS transporter, MCP family, solute carrier family 16, member 6 [Daldinia vernicosa]|uniref:MFS transporter, MCP family, solute carrier family 16, member 6 n=1 Tax=Daldinia vernicosa TaxID=114800 RepID=UPI002007CABF|nr:MFS transporter, MCP family, solute carrier family 16, member 6 [Daldinia vernicosa]KAI0848042.1 MFS transporter, MCP family, solute carrier family 16, member 6 [Daldinia vernicosa]